MEKAKSKVKSLDVNIQVEETKKTNYAMLKSTEDNNKKTWWLLATIIAVPLTLLTGLLVNYFYFYPNTEDDNGALHGKFIASNNIASITIVAVLGAVIIAYLAFLIFTMRKRVVFDNNKKDWTLTSVGFVASFLDAIGVGSYAIAIGMMKATKTVGEDKKLPGTLTVGLAIPQMVEASIFVGSIQVDIPTLLILTACSIVGGIVGALLANKINNQMFRIIIGVAMFVIGIIMIFVHPQVAVIPLLESGKGTIFLHGWRLAVGIVAFLVLGATSALGLGMFAPSLAILTLLGMQADAIFPIMSLAASAMMPPAAIKFFKDKNYQSLHSITFTLGGVFGTLASFLVIFVGLQVGAKMDKEQFDLILKWVAVVVVFYCSFLMLFDFGKDYRKWGWKAEEGNEVL